VKAMKLNINKEVKNMIKWLSIVQLLMSFVMAMLGTITMFHFDIFTGMLIILVGMYGMIRATNRVNYE
tara:strand:+ start:20 stop:223 length:204 start_codon:yes stop_codon:yes gene_type:complete